MRASKGEVSIHPRGTSRRRWHDLSNEEEESDEGGFGGRFGALTLEDTGADLTDEEFVALQVYGLRCTKWDNKNVYDFREDHAAGNKSNGRATQQTGNKL